MTDSAEAPFVRVGPERPVSPVVLSVPHAGRAYSPALLRAARLPRETLETLEDRLVDRLIWRAVDAGATAFIACAPRAEIDLNRDEREIDPSLISPPLPSAAIIDSPRARGGIGLIPSRLVGSGAIWKARIERDELVRRIVEIHQPYHAALERALKAARDRFGAALLLDCHSMPAGAGSDGATIVFGDRYGTTIAPHLVEAAVDAVEGLGYRTARNAPYAGGYVTGRHGRPGEAIHALQIEIDRAVYLDMDLRAPGTGFADACRMVEAVVGALEDTLIGPAQTLAAE